MANGAEFLMQVFQLILSEDGVKGGGGIDVLVNQQAREDDDIATIEDELAGKAVPKAMRVDPPGDFGAFFEALENQGHPRFGQAIVARLLGKLVAFPWLPELIYWTNSSSTFPVLQSG